MVDAMIRARQADSARRRQRVIEDCERVEVLSQSRTATV